MEAHLASVKRVFGVCFLQQIDTLIRGNLADIVVELLMTLYEGAVTAERGDLQKFIG